MCAGATDSHGSRPCATHSSSSQQLCDRGTRRRLGDDEQPLSLREAAARRAPDGAADPLERLARHGLRVVVPDHAALLQDVGESSTPATSQNHSHSIVAGGFDVTSRTTRFTAGISLTMREEIVSIRSYGSRAQSAVIASSLVTARSTIG